MNKLTKGLLVVLIGLAIWFIPTPAGLKPQRSMTADTIHLC